MRVQVDRQASLLLSISDLGEGLLITEDGRYVGSNDAYVKLTGYTQAELRALPSLIDLAPPEEQEMLRATYSKRAAGDVSPVRYEAGLVTKDGRRVQVEVAIHQIDSEGPRRPPGPRRRQQAALFPDRDHRHPRSQAGRGHAVRSVRGDPSAGHLAGLGPSRTARPGRSLRGARLGTGRILGG